MSPARSRRTPVPHRRSRADIAQAVGVGAAIVLLTAVLIWLMRPGSAGTLGTGGLVNRQPRAGGLVLVTILVAVAVTWWVLRVSKRSRGNEKVILPVALGVIVVAAVVAGLAWPDGLLRHYLAAPEPITPATTPSTSPGATTGATGATSSSTTPTPAPTTGISTTTSP